MKKIRVLCETAQLAVECTRAAAELDLRLEPTVAAIDKAGIDLLTADGQVCAIVACTPPTSALLFHASSLAIERHARIGFALIGGNEPSRAAREIATDLGLVAVDEVEPLFSALVLLGICTKPWTASTRGLLDLDKLRMREALPSSSEKSSEKFVAMDNQLLGIAYGNKAPIPLGTARTVAAALLALRAATSVPPSHAWGQERREVDLKRVNDTIFGPARALSDPASKAALGPYGVPVPNEELCTSASRAASEAARIGLPVRVALASPDLRVWDHPDLAVDSIDNAARVRDVFHQIMGLAQGRSKDARLLGVTVASTSIAYALLSVRMTVLNRAAGKSSPVLVQIGFADPHGLASRDMTTTVLPAPMGRLEIALSRLRGSPLLFEAGGRARKETLEGLNDVLTRLAQFVADHPREVESVEVHPLALVIGGSAEVREARITITDVFTTSLEKQSPDRSKERSGDR